MSEQASTQDPSAPPGPAQIGPSRDHAAQPLRIVGLVAVCVGVAALAAATFVLSYSGIHTMALQAGITPRYARDYPLLLDAMLVIALAAVLGLRGAGIPSRVLAWLTLLVVLGAAASADAIHATGHRLQHNAAAITAAVLPWALVLIAFLLLLALLRHIRLRRHAGTARREPTDLPADADRASRTGHQVLGRPAAPLPVRTPQPWNSAAIVPGFSSQLVSSAVAGAAAGAAVPEAESWFQDGTALDDALSPDADADQAATAVDAPEPVSQPAPVLDDDTGAPDAGFSLAEDETDQPGLDAEPAVPDDEAGLQPDQPDPLDGEAQPEQAVESDDMPAIDRIGSSPTPPEA